MSENYSPQPDDNADRDEQLEAVIADYIRACETGTAPDRGEILERHPELAEELRQFFANRDRLERIVAPMQADDQFKNPQSAADQIGLCIGPYTLVQKLGEGGMGVVWVAKQSSPVKRKVAIKLIKGGINSREILSRFEQERQALAMMDHPNIARVFDGGVINEAGSLSVPSATETGNSPLRVATAMIGQPYFVMELVNGLPLTKYCDEARLTLRERLQLFVPICQAVQHAHQKGIVHRDLKPSNILVTIYDGRPVPKVIDFGVAKATGGKLTDEPVSTQFGAVVGTLEYMSPEQAGFSSQDIDTRADIYSLGVILYELLTGLRPIDGQRLRKAALAEMIRMIQEEEPSKPSMRLSSEVSLPSLAALRQTEPKRLTALLRGELDWVVMKCLEKSRDRRYESVNGLARDIQRYLADEPVEACPASASYRLSKFLRRHKGPVLAASLFVVALIVGIIGTSVGLVRAELARKSETLQREIAERNERKANEAAHQEREQRDRADQNANLAGRRMIELNETLSKLTEEEQKASEALVAERIASNNLEKTNQSLKDTIEREQESNYYNNILLAWREWQAGHVDVAENHLKACREDLRSWEWNYLARLCRPTESLATLERVHGIGDPNDGLEPPGICLSGDGKRLAYAAGGRFVVVVDSSTGNELIRTQHTDTEVLSVALSHDCRWLAALGKESITIWEMSTLKSRVKRLPDPDKSNQPNRYNRLAFSPDASRLIVSEQASRMVSRVDSLKRWCILKATIVDVGSLESVASQRCNGYSLDGRRIVTIGRNNEIVISQIDDKKEISLARHDATVAGCVFSPDGTRIATFDIQSNILVWDTASGERINTWDLRPDRIDRIRFSPDGSKIVTLSFLSNLKVWDVLSGQLVHFFRETEIERVSVIGAPSATDIGNYSAHQFFDFSPDSKRLASASGNHKVTVWNLDTGKVAAFRTREPLSFVAFKSGAEQNVIYATQINPMPAIAKPGIALARSDLAVKLNTWNLLSQDDSRTLYNPGAFYHTVAVNHAGTRIASISKPSRYRENTIKIWNMKSGIEELSLACESGGEPFGLAFSPDDSLLAVSDRKKGVAIMDLATQEIRPSRIGRRGELVTFCRDGERILVSGTSINNLQTGENLVNFPGGWVMAFNADESRVATGWHSHVKCFNAATGEIVLDLSIKPSELKNEITVSCVTFSPDSSRLAAADWTGHIHVWDSLTGMQLLKLPAHQGRAYTVTFSHDGRRLVSMGDEGVLRVWDSKNGHEILTLTGHADRVYHATFTHDGSQIVSTSADGTIRIWDGRPIIE